MVTSTKLSGVSNSATAFDGTELTYVVQAGNGAKALTSDFKTYALGDFSAPGLAIVSAGSYSAIRTAMGLGSAALENIGASGATVPLLSAANTWTLAQTFTAAPVFTDAPGTLTALGVSTFAKTILDDVDAAAVRATIGAGTGGGDASGPASSVDGHVALFDSTTGKLLKDSGLATLANGANITPAAAPATNAVGYLGAPQMSDQDDYTLVMGDAGKHYYHVSGSTHTLTIPANASVAFPIGTIIAGVNEDGGGDLTIAITSDTLRWTDQTGSRTVAENGTFSLIKVTSTVWRLTGDGIT